jgi:hypothetical protein
MIFFPKIQSIHLDFDIFRNQNSDLEHFLFKFLTFLIILNLKLKI